jgi:hypothetical protein
VATCNRPAYAKKLSEVRKMIPRLPAELRPLFKHILNLSRSNLKGSKGKSVPMYLCQRAGRELRMAKNLVTKHGR